MSNESDMDERPATQRQMREAIAEAVAPLATKQELRDEIGQLRDEFGQLRGEFGQLQRNFEQLGRDLSEDLARHTRAILEEFRRSLTAVDDQYRTLPARVQKLEDTVYAPKPKRVRRAR